MSLYICCCVVFCKNRKLVSVFSVWFVKILECLSPDSSGNPFLRFFPKKRLQRIAGIAPKNIYHKNGIFFEGAIKIKYICKN